MQFILNKKQQEEFYFTNTFFTQLVRRDIYISILY